MPANKRSANLQQGDDEDSQQNHHRQRRKQSRRGGGDQPTSSRRPALPPLEHHDPYEQEKQQDQPTPSDQYPVEPNPQEDSDGSGTEPEAFDELVTVMRSNLRNNVQCPICLGIIKKTRTVMGCLHRFCRECIDKSMRLGNNECPACRIHCASRRSLRDDLDFDALIDAIYPDVEKYEEEELVFRDEDKTRNEQIQASIAQISIRQSEALNKRHKLAKDTDDVSPLRIPRSSRNAYSRRRINQRTELEEYDCNERDNDHDGNENPSENCETEIKHRRRKRRTGGQSSTMSPSAASPDGGCFDNPMLPIKEEIGVSLGHVHNPETLTWGRGGARSHTRHGGASGSRSNRGIQPSKLIDLESVPNNDNESNVHTLKGGAGGSRNTRGIQLSKLMDHPESVPNNDNELDVHTPHGGPSDSRSNRATRLSKLINHLESVPNNDNKSDVHFTLIPLDEESKPSLEKPFFCCPPSLSVKQLREHVGHEINSQAEDIRMLSVESAGDAGKSTLNSSIPMGAGKSTLNSSIPMGAGKSMLNSSIPTDAPNLQSQIASWPIMNLQVLEGQETLAGLSCSSKNERLILGFEKKKDSSQIEPSPV